MTQGLNRKLHHHSSKDALLVLCYCHSKYVHLTWKNLMVSYSSLHRAATQKVQKDSTNILISPLFPQSKNTWLLQSQLFLKTLFFNCLDGLNMSLITMMVSPIIWPPLWHKPPNTTPCTHKRADIFHCQIYCSSAEDAQQPTLTCLLPTGLGELCQGQTSAELSRAATDCLQIVHIWLWSICKLYFSVRHYQMHYSKTSFPRLCQGTLSGKRSP